MGIVKLQTGDLVERMYLSIRKNDGKIGVPSIPELGIILDVDSLHYTLYTASKKICWMSHATGAQFRILQRISSGAKDEV